MEQVLARLAGLPASPFRRARGRARQGSSAELNPEMLAEGGLSLLFGLDGRLRALAADPPNQDLVAERNPPVRRRARADPLLGEDRFGRGLVIMAHLLEIA